MIATAFGGTLTVRFQFATPILFAALAAPALSHPGPHHDIERLDKLLATHPDRADLLMERARAYRYDGRPKDSLTDLERAEKLGADAMLVALERGLSLVALGRDAEAESELSRHINGPNPKAAAFAERAAIHQRHDRIPDAIKDYASAIALVPDVNWYLARGRLLESLSRPDEAAGNHREGLTRCSGAIVLRMELLRIEVSRRRFDSAIALIDEVLPYADIKADWYLRRAEVLDAAGRAGEARHDRMHALLEAEEAIALRPTAQRLLMRAKALLALDKSEQAAVDLRAALRKSPTLAEAADLLDRIDRKLNTKSATPPAAAP